MSEVEQVFLTKMADVAVDPRPPPPDWLNSTFVQTALRNGEADSTCTVVSCDVSMGCAVGEGFGSDIYRIKATLKNGEQRSLIVKCRAQQGVGRAFEERIHAFDRETKMLTETLPAMHSLLEKAYPEEIQNLGAKCHYHGSEPLPFLVLEDLRDAGFTVAERRHGLDYSHCSIVMRTIARFHAASIALHERYPAELKYYDESNFRESIRDIYEEFSYRGVCSLANEVQNWLGYEKYSHKLLKMKNFMFNRLVETCRRKNGALNALIHGDMWVANMMFRYSSDTVIDLKLLDFQTVVYSSPALDICHFLHACGNYDVQTNRMNELIEEYHSALNETLNFLDCSQLLVSLEEILALCSEYNFYSFYVSTTIFPYVAFDPEDKIKQENVTDSNNSQKLRVFKGNDYKRLMKYYLPIYEQQGIL